MASKLGTALGIETTEDEPIVNSDKLDEPIVVPTPTQVSEEEADRIALERINKARGTDFKTLEEAFSTINTPAPAPLETEEEKRKKKQNEMVKYALENNVVSADEFENYHKDSAREARETVFADYQAKHKANGKSDEWIQKTFAKMYGEDLEDEDENDDVTPAVKAAQQERLKKDASKILRNKYPKVHTLEKEYDSFLTKSQKDNQERERLLTNGKAYLADVESFFGGVKPIKLKVIGELGKPETDWETEFSYPKEVLDKVKNEVLEENTLLSLIGSYNKESLYKYINMRLTEESEPYRIGHVAKKYHDNQVDKKNIHRKELNDDNLSSGGGSSSSQPRSILAQRTGVYNDAV